MKKKLAIKYKADTNLIHVYSNQVLRPNLYLRENGIFYFRKTIRGRQLLKSLKTKDPLLAVFLTNRLKESLMNKDIDDLVALINNQSDPEAKRKQEEDFLQRAERANRKYEISVLSKDSDYIIRKQIFLSLHPDKNEDYIYDHLSELYSDEINSKLQYTNVATLNSIPTKKHKIADLWKEYRYEHYIKHALLDLQKVKIEDINDKNEQELIKMLTKHHRYELTRHEGHMKFILNILPETIEEIDTKPSILRELMNRLYSYEHKEGKYWTAKSLERVLEPIKGILDEAKRNLIIKNYDNYAKNLHIEPSKVKQPSNEREPFDDTSLPKIFQMLVDLHKHDFSFIHEAYEDKSNPIHKKDGLSFIISKTNKTPPVEQYPEPIVYAVLIGLYSGCRAGASSTIRFTNIDIENKTISIKFDSDNNIRSQEKHLKASNVSKASIRTIPWPDVLLGLGFEKYVKHNKRLYGKEAYLFEGILRTNKNKPDKLTFRTSTISEIFRLLLVLLKIKPDTETGILKDFHSLKTTFYTYNQSLPNQGAVRALAGNKAPKNADTDDQFYKKSTLDLMRETMKQIHYPGEEILLEYIKTLK